MPMSNDEAVSCVEKSKDIYSLNKEDVLKIIRIRKYDPGLDKEINSKNLKMALDRIYNKLPYPNFYLFDSLIKVLVNDIPTKTIFKVLKDVGFKLEVKVHE